MSIATNEQAVVDAVTPRLYIGGEWREASGGGSFAVEDPATGEVLCEVADASPADGLAEVFAERLAERMRGLRVGRGTEDGVQVGPLINQDAVDKVSELVGDALERGARAVVGARPGDGRGYFYQPTVLGGVPDGARVLKEEIFGPVAPVAAFDGEEAAVAAANDTEFGLVAYVYTRDLRRAFRVVEGLETGMVGLNQGLVSNPAAPFGGVKQSGFGREGGPEGIAEYLETKYVAINL
jgi:succinate-semialdehyde dehydrogenase / glutarate-semialdehyde dehydrogenase